MWFLEIILVVFFLASQQTLAISESELEKRLTKVIKSSSIPSSSIGLSVLNLSLIPQKAVFGLNEARQFMPASVTELATASAVLAKLGPSYKFQTTLSSSGSIKGTVLNGDLYLLGGGDPGFVSETMWFLVNEFTRTGVTLIDGDLVVDDSAFDSIRADSSRDPERVDRAYDAPVGAMSFNWNSINIYVRAGNKVGDAVEVILDPLRDYYKVDNKAKTVAGGANGISLSRVDNRIVVRGKLGINLNEIVSFKNIDDPVDWSGRNLEFFLSQRGITLKGKVKAGRQPPTAKILAKAESKPVSQSVADMLKFSNNYVAEMLTKGLAISGSSRGGTMEQGMGIIRRHLTEDIGLEASRVKLYNPSGLSRRNQISPRDLAEILLRSQHDFPTFAEFLSGLPLAGQDGTLKRRMRSNGAAGWVRAKTGNLNGVVSLAGYAGGADGELMAFAFLFNGKTNQEGAARQLFDALASELVQ